MRGNKCIIVEDDVTINKDISYLASLYISQLEINIGAGHNTIVHGYGLMKSSLVRRNIWFSNVFWPKTIVSTHLFLLLLAVFSFMCHSYFYSCVIHVSFIFSCRYALSSSWCESKEDVSQPFGYSLDSRWISWCDAIRIQFLFKWTQVLFKWTKFWCKWLELTLQSFCNANIACWQALWACRWETSIAWFWSQMVCMYVMTFIMNFISCKYVYMTFIMHVWPLCIYVWIYVCMTYLYVCVALMHWWPVCTYGFYMYGLYV